MFENAPSPKTSKIQTQKIIAPEKVTIQEMWENVESLKIEISIGRRLKRNIGLG
jgi:hypothetical protein